MRALSVLVLLSGWLSANGADDRLWMEAKINGKPIRLCFDTGSDRIVLMREAAARLGLKVTDPPSNYVPSFSSVALGTTEECELTMAGTTLKTALATVRLPPWEHLEVDGMVGWSAIGQNLLFIDAENLAFRFLDKLPEQVNGWTQLHIDTNSAILRLELPDDQGHEETLLVDTGDPSGGIELPPQKWREWKTAHKHHPFTLRATYSPADGPGFAEESFARIFAIGPLLLRNVPVMQADLTSVTLGSPGYAATLGMAALKRLDLVLDGEHGIAYLRSKGSPAPPYEYNRLGVVFVPKDLSSEDRVAHVLKGSPAQHAGIRNGDLLLQVDGTDVTHWRTDTNALEISKVFRRPAGTKVSLTLRRDGKTIRTGVVLRDILAPIMDRPSGIKEEDLGEFPDRRANLVLSRDGLHIAYSIFQGSNQCVVVDGHVGQPYEGIGADTLQFSPAGGHVAFVAFEGGKQFVVLDGKPGAKFDGTGKQSLTFSPSGNHLAYTAWNGDKWAMVLDGKPGSAYDGLTSPVFSMDGAHMAYRAKRAGKWVAVVDGTPEYRFTGDIVDLPVFSADGKHLAYRAGKSMGQTVVVNGRSGPFYDAVGAGGICFSPDGNRLAYPAQRGGGWFSVIDGTEGPHHEGLWDAPILFSPDSHRVAYVATDAGKWMVVADGRKSPQHDGIIAGSLLFSPDSKHLIYEVNDGHKTFMILDGQPSPAYDGILDRTLVISPDSQHVAYGAGRGDRRFVVLDGQEGTDLDGIGLDSLHFSPDGHRLAYSAGKGREGIVVLDGKPGPAYDAILPGTPVFSANSKHVAYAAYSEWKISKWCVVLDGVCQTEWDDIIPNSLSFQNGGILTFLASKEDRLYRVRGPDTSDEKVQPGASQRRIRPPK